MKYFEAPEIEVIMFTDDTNSIATGLTSDSGEIEIHSDQNGMQIEF